MTGGRPSGHCTPGPGRESRTRAAHNQQCTPSTSPPLNGTSSLSGAITSGHRINNLHATPRKGPETVDVPCRTATTNPGLLHNETVTTALALLYAPCHRI